MPGEALYKNEDEKVSLEARNGLLLFDTTIELIDEAQGVLALTPKLIKTLQGVVIQGLYSCAGEFRTWPVRIKGSLHRPPHHRHVEGLVADMCELANSSLDWSPVKTAAYIHWRLSWIHPFGGGNGRTSRAASYLALCVRLGFKPRGRLTVLEQLGIERKRCQAALEDADRAEKEHSLVDVSEMEALMDELLQKQLTSFRSDSESLPGGSLA